MKNCLIIISYFFFISMASAQFDELAPLIKDEMEDSHIMFRKTVWRRMKLDEKQNLPFYTKGAEISRLLLDAVDEGLLTPYRSDSCKNIMPDIIFVSNVSIERDDNPFVGSGFGGAFSDFEEEEEEAEEPDGNDLLSLEGIPADLFSSIWIREEVIFDRNRSRMYYKIKSLSIYLPRDAGPVYNPGGFEKQVAHFKFDDVVSLFRGPYANKATYYNRQNEAANMNMSDAFELRLFSAPIIKISNAQDLDIREIYGENLADNPLKAILVQQEYEHNLLEYESELWEY